MEDGNEQYEEDKYEQQPDQQQQEQEQQEQEQQVQVKQEYMIDIDAEQAKDIIDIDEYQQMMEAVTIDKILIDAGLTPTLLHKFQPGKNIVRANRFQDPRQLGPFFVRQQEIFEQSAKLYNKLAEDRSYNNPQNEFTEISDQDIKQVAKARKLITAQAPSTLDVENANRFMNDVHQQYKIYNNVLSDIKQNKKVSEYNLSQLGHYKYSQKLAQDKGYIKSIQSQLTQVQRLDNQQYENLLTQLQATADRQQLEDDWKEISVKQQLSTKLQRIVPDMKSAKMKQYLEVKAAGAPLRKEYYANIVSKLMNLRRQTTAPPINPILQESIETDMLKYLGDALLNWKIPSDSRVIRQVQLATKYAEYDIDSLDSAIFQDYSNLMPVRIVETASQIDNAIDKVMRRRDKKNAGNVAQESSAIRRSAIGKSTLGKRSTTREPPLANPRLKSTAQQLKDRAIQLVNVQQQVNQMPPVTTEVVSQAFSQQQQIAPPIVQQPPALVVNEPTPRPFSSIPEGSRRRDRETIAIDPLQYVIDAEEELLGTRVEENKDAKIMHMRDASKIHSPNKYDKEAVRQEALAQEQLDKEREMLKQIEQQEEKDFELAAALARSEGQEVYEDPMKKIEEEKKEVIPIGGGRKKKKPEEEEEKKQQQIDSSVAPPLKKRDTKKQNVDENTSIDKQLMKARQEFRQARPDKQDNFRSHLIANWPDIVLAYRNNRLKLPENSELRPILQSMSDQINTSEQQILKDYKDQPSSSALTLRSILTTGLGMIDERFDDGVIDSSDTYLQGIMKKAEEQQLAPPYVSRELLYNIFNGGEGYASETYANNDRNGSKFMRLSSLVNDYVTQEHIQHYKRDAQLMREVEKLDEIKDMKIASLMKEYANTQINKMSADLEGSFKEVQRLITAGVERVKARQEQNIRDNTNKDTFKSNEYKQLLQNLKTNFDVFQTTLPRKFEKAKEVLAVGDNIINFVKSRSNQAEMNQIEYALDSIINRFATITEVVNATRNNDIRAIRELQNSEDPLIQQDSTIQKLLSTYQNMDQKTRDVVQQIMETTASPNDAAVFLTEGLPQFKTGAAFNPIYQVIPQMIADTTAKFALAAQVQTTPSYIGNLQHIRAYNDQLYESLKTHYQVSESSQGLVGMAGLLHNFNINLHTSDILPQDFSAEELQFMKHAVAVDIDDQYQPFLQQISRRKPIARQNQQQEASIENILTYIEPHESSSIFSQIGADNGIQMYAQNVVTNPESLNIGAIVNNSAIVGDLHDKEFEQIQSQSKHFTDVRNQQESIDRQNKIMLDFQKATQEYRESSAKIKFKFMQETPPPNMFDIPLGENEPEFQIDDSSAVPLFPEDDDDSKEDEEDKRPSNQEEGKVEGMEVDTQVRGTDVVKQLLSDLGKNIDGNDDKMKEFKVNLRKNTNAIKKLNKNGKTLNLKGDGGGNVRKLTTRLSDIQKENIEIRERLKQLQEQQNFAVQSQNTLKNAQESLAQIVEDVHGNVKQNTIKAAKFDTFANEIARLQAITDGQISASKDAQTEILQMINDLKKKHTTNQTQVTAVEAFLNTQMKELIDNSSAATRKELEDAATTLANDLRHTKDQQNETNTRLVSLDQANEAFKQKTTQSLTELEDRFTDINVRVSNMEKTYSQMDMAVAELLKKSGSRTNAVLDQRYREYIKMSAKSVKAELTDVQQVYADKLGKILKEQIAADKTAKAELSDKIDNKLKTEFLKINNLFKLMDKKDAKKASKSQIRSGRNEEYEEEKVPKQPRAARDDSALLVSGVADGDIIPSSSNKRFVPQSKLDKEKDVMKANKERDVVMDLLVKTMTGELQADSKQLQDLIVEKGKSVQKARYIKAMSRKRGLAARSSRQQQQIDSSSQNQQEQIKPEQATQRYRELAQEYIRNIGDVHENNVTQQLATLSQTDPITAGIYRNGLMIMNSQNRVNSINFFESLIKLENVVDEDTRSAVVVEGMQQLQKENASAMQAMAVSMQKQSFQAMTAVQNTREKELTKRDDIQRRNIEQNAKVQLEEQRTKQKQDKLNYEESLKQMHSREVLAQKEIEQQRLRNKHTKIQEAEATKRVEITTREQAKTAKAKDKLENVQAMADIKKDKKIAETEAATQIKVEKIKQKEAEIAKQKEVKIKQIEEQAATERAKIKDQMAFKKDVTTINQQHAENIKKIGYTQQKEMYELQHNLKKEDRVENQKLHEINERKKFEQKKELTEFVMSKKQKESKQEKFDELIRKTQLSNQYTHIVADVNSRTQARKITKDIYQNLRADDASQEQLSESIKPLLKISTQNVGGSTRTLQSQVTDLVNTNQSSKTLDYKKKLIEEKREEFKKEYESNEKEIYDVQAVQIAHDEIISRFKSGFPIVSNMSDIVKMMSMQPDDPKYAYSIRADHEVNEKVRDHVQNEIQQQLAAQIKLTDNGEIIKQSILNNYQAMHEFLESVRDEGRRSGKILQKSSVDKFLTDSMSTLQMLQETCITHNTNVKKINVDEYDKALLLLTQKSSLKADKDESKKKVFQKVMGGGVNEIMKMLRDTGLLAQSVGGSLGIPAHAIQEKSALAAAARQYPGKNGKQLYAQDRLKQVLQPPQQYKPTHEDDKVQTQANLIRFAKQVPKLEQSDLQLLAQAVIDKQTGLIYLQDENGEMQELNDEQKERLAFILIEIFVYVYAKYLKSGHKKTPEAERQALTRNIQEGNTDLLPMMRIANSIANKISYGNVRNATLQRYFNALEPQQQATSKTREEKPADEDMQID